MTGWQSGDGGWNQNQSFGPDAQTNRYGPDPYASDPYGYGNQYGNDPTPYGADPYAAGYDPYQQQQQYPPQQQYPQQYPPTGGFPAQGYGPPPPPPKRSKLPMVLSLVAILIIVGAVVAIVLVNRQGGQPVAQDDPTSTSAPSDPPSSKSESPSSTTPSGGNDDWISIDNKSDAGLTYQVPPDWKKTEGPYDSGLGVEFTGGADYGTYDCEGKPYVRTFVASGDVQGKEGKDLELAATVEDFATAWAKAGYGEDAQVDVQAPTETEIDGKPAMLLTAKVKQNVTAPNCQATDGEVALVGVQVQDEGQPKGVAILVVVNDTAGGPGEPKPLDPSVTQEILKTVRSG